MPGIMDYGPAQHGGPSRGSRTFSAASMLLSGITAISFSQLLSAPLKVMDPETYSAYMAWTKENFAILMIAITEWWAPTIVRVGGDASMKDQLYQMEDGSLKCNFPHRIVLMANHQLYTDWLYMWWIAYTNKMHGHIYIILKASLKQVPILGWGMQYFNFIFLNRKWENDEYTFGQHLNRLSNGKPAWVMIFPEGTNLSQVTREKSAAWSERTGIPDMKHQLLPRMTGLQFCLKAMKSSTNWLYDATIAYEGVPEGSYGQDIFTLQSSFFHNRPPKSVNIFWRRFKITDIPYENSEAFSRWLLNRWREKDYMLEFFSKFGRFPAGNALQALTVVDGKKNVKMAKAITTQITGSGWDEFLRIFGPVTTAASTMSALSAAQLSDLIGFVPSAGVRERLKTLNLDLHGEASKGQNSARNASRLAARSSASVKPTIDVKSVKKPLPTPQKKSNPVKADRRQEMSHGSHPPSDIKTAMTSENEKKSATPPKHRASVTNSHLKVKSIGR